MLNYDRRGLPIEEKKKDRSKIWALAFAITVLVVVLGMFFYVSKIPHDANDCLTNPLAFKEAKLGAEHGTDFDCSCSEHQKYDIVWAGSNG